MNSFGLMFLLTLTGKTIREKKKLTSITDTVWLDIFQHFPADSILG